MEEDAVVRRRAGAEEEDAGLVDWSGAFSASSVLAVSRVRFVGPAMMVLISTRTSTTGIGRSCGVEYAVKGEGRWD